MKFAVILAAAVMSCAGLRPAFARQHRKAAPPSPAVDPFVGTWRLNLYKSKLGATDRILADERNYDRYDGRVIVTWTQDFDGRKSLGSYAAKCDGKPADLPDGAVLVCRYVVRNIVEGEIHDRKAPADLYFRRSVSGDGKILTITWYGDALRTHLVTTRIYDRAPE